MNRRHMVIVIVVILLFLSILINFLYLPIIKTDNGIKYTVRTGASMNGVIEELASKKIIPSEIILKILVKVKNNAHELKAGEYFFAPGTSLTKLLSQITTGGGLIYHSFTIIPGWSFKQIQQALAANAYLKHETKSLNNASILKLVGSTAIHPEGLFYPDTYYFAEGSTDITLLKLAYNAMQEKLKNLWQQRDADLPLTSPYEVLIVASLIEKEAEQNSERHLISGVIINRLKKNMLLQIDPTLIYGMGENYKGTLKKSDILNSNPYNTYVHKGLPPTPIASPSWASLHAAVHPQKHEYFYFVLRTPNDSLHQFSKTLEEHNRAVAESRKVKPIFFNGDLVRQYINQNLGI